jgi:hypothetical protein
MGAAWEEDDPVWKLIVEDAWMAEEENAVYVMSVPRWRDTVRDETNHRYFDLKRLRLYAHIDIPHGSLPIMGCDHSCTLGNLLTRK